MRPEIISRDAAKALGLKRYFDGTPCQRGHVTERYTRDKACCQCGLERVRVCVGTKAATRSPAHYTKPKKLSKALNPTLGSAFPVDVEKLMGRR